MRFRRLGGGFLLTLLAGCTGTPIRVLSVTSTDPVLVVRFEPLQDGMTRMFVQRRWVRRVEVGGSHGLQVADSPVQQLQRRAFIAGDDGPFEATLGRTLEPAASAVLEGVHDLFTSLQPRVLFAPRQVEEVAFEPVLRVTVETAGGGRVDLGVQPADGYRLDPATLRRLGEPGAAVILREGDVQSCDVRLPASR